MDETLLCLYICCHGTESVHCGSGFQTVWFSKLYIYHSCKVLQLYMSTRIEKYTVGLGLPLQNVLRCVLGLEGISGMEVHINSYKSCTVFI